MRPAIALILTLFLVLSGQMVAVAKGVSAHQSGLIPFCLGGVTLSLPGDDGDTVLACPDGVLAASVLVDPGGSPPRPATAILDVFTAPAEAQVPLGPSFLRPQGRAPPALA